MERRVLRRSHSRDSFHDSSFPAGGRGVGLLEEGTQSLARCLPGLGRG